MSELELGIGRGTEVPYLDGGKTNSRRRRLVLVVCVAFGGISLSFLLAGMLWLREQRFTAMRFELEAGRRIEAMQMAVYDRLGTLSMAAAFLSGSEAVDRKEFCTFATPFIKSRDELQALAWAPRIPASQRKTHVQAVRQSGFPQYEIRQYDQQGRLVPAGQRKDYYPILFVEPFGKKNQSLPGFDLGSDPACLAAIQKAMSTGNQVAVAGRTRDLNGNDRSLLYVVQPVKNVNIKAEKRPADQPESDGVVLGIFNMGTIVERLMTLFFVPTGIDVSLSVPSKGGGQEVVYTWLYSPPGDQERPQGPAEQPVAGDILCLSREIAAADQRWNMKCVPTDSYLARWQTREPIGVALAGVLVTALLVGCLWLLTGRTARVERLVAERTAELRTISSAALDAVIAMDVDGRVLHWNPAAERIFGYSSEEILGRNIHDTLAPARYRGDAEKGMREFAGSGRGRVVGRVLEFEALRKDGSEFPAEISVASIPLKNGRGAVAVIRDITNRKRDEEALHEEQRLLSDMLDLHERERKLVAYEIHDGLTQQLTAAIYKFEALGQLYERDPEAARVMFEEALRLLRNAMAEARRLISGLRPPVLDESGVVAAIDCLVAEHMQQNGPEIEFVHELETSRFAPPLESAVFRIVQECLTNACRYSRSQKIRVELRQTGDNLRVGVRDWGVGFDPAEIKRDHFGLQGIRERARLLGGTVTIESVPKQGAHITVELPLVPQVESGTA